MKTKKRSGPNRGGPTRLFFPSPEIVGRAMKIVMRMTKEDRAQAFGPDIDQPLDVYDQPFASFEPSRRAE